MRTLVLVQLGDARLLQLIRANRQITEQSVRDAILGEAAARQEAAVAAPRTEDASAPLVGLEGALQLVRRDVRDARQDIDFILQRCVLPTDQLIVSQYLAEYAMNATLGERDSRMLFGRLVSQEIAARCLSDTVSREPYGDEQHRYVYRNSLHRGVFDYVRRHIWPAALRRAMQEKAAVAARVSVARQFEAMYRERMASMPPVSSADNLRRMERMRRTFQRMLPLNAHTAGAMPSERDGQFVWTHRHLDIMRETFDCVVGMSLEDRQRSRSAHGDSE